MKAYRNLTDLLYSKHDDDGNNSSHDKKDKTKSDKDDKKDEKNIKQSQIKEKSPIEKKKY